MYNRITKYIINAHIIDHAKTVIIKFFPVQVYHREHDHKENPM